MKQLRLLLLLLLPLSVFGQSGRWRDNKDVQKYRENGFLLLEGGFSFPIGAYGKQHDDNLEDVSFYDSYVGRALTGSNWGITLGFPINYNGRFSWVGGLYMNSNPYNAQAYAFDVAKQNPYLQVRASAGYQTQILLSILGLHFTVNNPYNRFTLGVYAQYISIGISIPHKGTYQLDYANRSVQGSYQLNPSVYLPGITSFRSGLTLNADLSKRVFAHANLAVLGDILNIFLKEKNGYPQSNSEYTAYTAEFNTFEDKAMFSHPWLSYVSLNFGLGYRFK